MFSRTLGLAIQRWYTPVLGTTGLMFIREFGLLSFRGIFGGTLVGAAMIPAANFIARECLKSVVENRIRSSLKSWSESAPSAEYSTRRIAAARIEICYMQNLPCLHLNNLQLTSLPIGLGYLTHLKKLDLRSNMLTDLSTELLDLPEECTVDVSYCPLEESAIRGICSATRGANFVFIYPT